MKKISLVIAAAFLLTGLSFAQGDKKETKKEEKKEHKAEKKEEKKEHKAEKKEDKKPK
jgi:preprotein translocase subunit SecG